MLKDLRSPPRPIHGRSLSLFLALKTCPKELETARFPPPPRGGATRSSRSAFLPVTQKREWSLASPWAPDAARTPPVPTAAPTLPLLSGSTLHACHPPPGTQAAVPPLPRQGLWHPGSDTTLPHQPQCPMSHPTACGQAHKTLTQNAVSHAGAPPLPPLVQGAPPQGTPTSSWEVPSEHHSSQDRPAAGRAEESLSSSTGDAEKGESGRVSSPGGDQSSLTGTQGSAERPRAGGRAMPSSLTRHFSAQTEARAHGTDAWQTPTRPTIKVKVTGQGSLFCVSTAGPSCMSGDSC